MKRLQSLLPTLLIGVCLLNLSTGCKSLAKWKETVFGTDNPCIVHLHTGTQKSTKDNEMNVVEISPGKLIYLDSPAVITPKHVAGFRVVPTPLGNQIELKLTSHGSFIWTQFTAINAGKTLVVMVDREYRGWIKAPRLDESGVIMLPGPFKAEEAKRIVERLELNRKNAGR